jgi:hypothetical protein
VCPSIQPLEVQRLAYVRFLYEEGVKESLRPAPLSSKALLSFHDAVEHFLGLAANHLGVDVNPKIDFMEYWGRLKPVQLPGKAAMDRLNHARVGLKHKGNFPAPESIEQHRTDVLNFLTAATTTVFSVDFQAVDMTDLVTQSETAQLLREAQTHADTGDYIAAMAGLSLAFEALLDHYSGSRSFDGWWQSPFSFGPELGHDRPNGHEQIWDDAARLAQKVALISERTQQGMQVISLGIDYPSYTRFQVLTPRVHAHGDGSQRYTVTPWHHRLTAEAEWKRSFVSDGGLVMTPLLAFQADTTQVSYSSESIDAIENMALNHPGGSLLTDIRDAYYRMLATVGPTRVSVYQPAPVAVLQELVVEADIHARISASRL